MTSFIIAETSQKTVLPEDTASHIAWVTVDPGSRSDRITKKQTRSMEPITPPHCQIVNLKEFWNPLMDAVTKRLEQTKDEKLKKADPELVMVEELTGVTETGFKKVDYLNNGIIVLKLMSKRQKTKNPRTGTKHDTFLPGIWVVALRIGVEEWGNQKVEQIWLLGVYDVTIEVQRDAYEMKMKELRRDSEEPKRSGYMNGRPCHKGGDDNPEPHHYICAPQPPFMHAEKI